MDTSAANPNPKYKTPVTDGRGKQQAQRFRDGVSHAPSKGNQTWFEIKKDMAETYLAYASQLGLKHESFPWEEEGTDVTGNTSKTLWMYLIVSGWERLASVKLNANPKKGFFGIERIVVKRTDLDKFNRGMFPIVCPALRRMIAGTNKQPELIGYNQPLGSLSLTRRVLDTAWRTAGLVLHDAHEDAGDIRMVFDRETFDASRTYYTNRKAKRRERQTEADAPRTTTVNKKMKSTPLPPTEVPTTKAASLPLPQQESTETSPTPERIRTVGRGGIVLSEELTAESGRLQKRLKAIAQAQGPHKEKLSALRSDHAATCVWLHTLGSRYSLEESRLYNLDTLSLPYANGYQLEDTAITFARLRQIESMRLEVERSLGEIHTAYFQTHAKIHLITSEIRKTEGEMKTLSNEHDSTERLHQSIEMRCMLTRFDD
jgi:hypothetical protein